jgi:hypothetical protein
MADEFHGENLELFKRPPTEKGTLGTEWITYRPINQLTKADGTQIKPSGEDADSVGVTNAPLHTMFSQVFSQVPGLQQQSMNQVGPNYPYKAFLDLLFDTEDNQELINQMFIKDDGGVDMDVSDPNSTNQGLFNRHEYT